MTLLRGVAHMTEDVCVKGVTHGDGVMQNDRAHKTKVYGRSKRGRMMEGSYTVEAAFLMPMITIIVFLLIMVAVYLRDVAIVRSIAYDVILEGRQLAQYDVIPGTDDIMYERELQKGIFSRILEDTDKEDAGITKSYFGKQLVGRLWMSEFRNADVEITESGIRVTVSVVAAGPFIELSEWIPGDFFRDEIVIEEACEDVTAKTRIYTAVVRTGLRIKGADTVISGLQRLLGGGED